MITNSLRFTTLCFGPILVLLILPGLIPLPLAIWNGFMVILSPQTTMSSALSFGVWSLIPLPLITKVTFSGRWIHQGTK